MLPRGVGGGVRKLDGGERSDDRCEWDQGGENRRFMGARDTLCRLAKGERNGVYRLDQLARLAIRSERGSRASGYVLDGRKYRCTLLLYDVAVRQSIRGASGIDMVQKTSNDGRFSRTVPRKMEVLTWVE